ncbi:MAG: hypothetical protein QOE92_1531, partial [Chloroflexota bacterium]|nr:hypothetical protein [Chloroflexota bacterium]
MPLRTEQPRAPLGGLVVAATEERSGTRRLLRVLLLVAVAAALLLTGITRAPRLADAGDPGTGGQLFQLTNQDRTSNGLGALGANGNLNSIATNAGGSCGGTSISGRSEDMINRQYFSHQIPPCGGYVWNVFNLGSFQAAGENIGWNNYPPSQSVGQINTAFMNSSEHRANILGNYTQLGVGVWQASGSWMGNNNVIMYTEIFIRGSGGGSAPPPAPKPPPPPKPKPTGGGSTGGSNAGNNSGSGSAPAPT